MGPYRGLPTPVPLPLSVCCEPMALPCSSPEVCLPPCLSKGSSFTGDLITLSLSEALICLSSTLKESKSIILIYRNNEHWGQDFLPEWDNSTVFQILPGRSDCIKH